MTQGDGDVPFFRAGLLSRPAQDPLPLPDQGSRRAAAARRPAAPEGVRDEGPYSFDRDEAGLDVSFRKHADAYGQSSTAVGSRSSPCRRSPG